MGASFQRGHLLRGPTPEPREWRSRDVVIVGGGVAGLAAAWRLAKRGIHAELFELEDVVGGTARSSSTPVSPHPWGAHYVNVPMAHNQDMIALLTEMGVMENGVVQEQFLCREPEERLFYKGRWYEGLYLRAGATKDDLAELARFNEAMQTLADAKPRAFAVPSSASATTQRALDAISMAEWMRPFTSERLRWLVDYACRDDYGARPQDISAWAGVFYFTARRDGEDTQSVVTWPEGNGRLIAHLRQSAHVTSGTIITALRPTPKGVDVIAIGPNGPFGVRAQHVICATPQFVAARLLNDPARAKGFTYSPWLVANLTLSDRPKSRGYSLSWDNVLYDSPSLGYVVATHQRGVERGPTVITYYLPLCDLPPAQARQQMLDTPRDAWAELVLRDLNKAHPDIRELVTRLDLMHWAHAMIRPTPGFLFSDGLAKARAAQGRIHFAHSDLSGIPLFEEAFDRALKAADAIT